VKKRWYVLVHQLPPRPIYLRAKIGQRLARVGAVALKNSVYVLPKTADCLEDFQWIAEEARGGGGGAHVAEASFVGEEDRLLVRRFTAERDADYAALKAIAEIVHDIDLKDGKFGRDDVAGIRQLLDGIVRSHRRDQDRLARGATLFDDLYASLRRRS
jgi:hypothetical protein